MNKPVFYISALLILCFSVYGAAFNEHASGSFLSLQGFLVTNFGWFYMSVVALFFFFILSIAFSRYGSVRLGPDDSRPDYTFFTWTAMLFSAGIGVGLMFFGVAEPITHFARPPVGVSGAAVIATNPAIAPLIAIVTSAFPLNILLANKAPITPPAAAILVLRKT